ncbi:hypothetical protein, partial [Acinetobacter sp. YH16057]|uniref:hypothetical protein n=1 Tax=Acinetobacter sp. YH16057 TaxID=2601195 RepID=UPI001C552151
EKFETISDSLKALLCKDGGIIRIFNKTRFARHHAAPARAVGMSDVGLSLALIWSVLVVQWLYLVVFGCTRIQSPKNCHSWGFTI